MIEKEDWDIDTSPPKLNEYKSIFNKTPEELNAQIEEIHRWADAKIKQDCKHPSLCFEDGGYYVVCDFCRVRWVAIKGSDLESDETRRNQGLTILDWRDKT